MEATPLRTGGQEETQAVIDKYQSMVYGCVLPKPGQGPTRTTCFRRSFWPT